MPERFPGYDVLDKRDTPSWNQKTRDVVDRRTAQREDSSLLGQVRLATLRRVVDRIAPQPEGQPPANTVALLCQHIASDAREGFRHAALPGTRVCWQRGLDAIDSEAQVRFRRPFAELGAERADTVLHAVESGDVRASNWVTLSPTLFWTWRLLPDIVSTHWSHPSLWNAMGFGGPASPRGYVRLDANHRDPWEAKEFHGGE